MSHKSAPSTAVGTLGTRMTNRYRGTELLRTAVIVLAMTIISALPSRAFFNYDFWIGQDFRTTIYSAGTHGQAEISGESGDANSPKRRLHTIGAIFNELRRCWVPPPSSQARTGMEITVRFAFKRNGEILAEPRVTYASAGASPDTRATYVNAIKAALNRCTPMGFSEGLAAVIVGHPFAIRFVDDRTGLGTG
jgi:hypothetical protein